MESWKPLRNFPGYAGSTEGRIKNIRTQHISTPTINSKGYALVGLSRNKKQHVVRAHRVLAETFLGEYPDLDVRHKDGNRSNNRIDNLEWVTRSETVRGSYESGAKKPWREIPIKVVETGNEYSSIKECAISTGCDPSEVRKCIIGERKSTKGLHFERI